MSDENVTESIANNNVDFMEIYVATVTPRNNVPRYINGRSVAMQGQNNVHIILCLYDKHACKHDDLAVFYRAIHDFEWDNTV